MIASRQKTKKRVFPIQKAFYNYFRENIQFI